MKQRPSKNGKRVRFQVNADPGAEVFVAGTFNSWNPQEFRLKSNGDDTVYVGVVPVTPGEHEYKFVVNGQWMPDPNNADWRPNDFGSLNSVLRV